MDAVLEATHRQLRKWAVGLIFPETLTLVLTVFRLLYRWRTRGLWWDDYLALVAMILVAPLFASTWLILLAPHWKHSMQIAIAWIWRTVFIPALWTTRISLALAIARIMPPGHPIHRVTLWMSIVFVALGTAISLQYIILCGRDLSWYNKSPFFCVPAKAQGMISMSADIIADLCLVYIPVRLFWRVKLPRGARMLVLGGFGGSLFTTLSTLIPTILLLIPFGVTFGGIITRAMVVHIVAIFSLTGCNTLVFVTFVYQLIHRNDLDLVAQLTSLSRTPRTPKTDTTGVDSVPESHHRSPSRSQAHQQDTISTGLHDTLAPNSLALTEISDSVWTDTYPADAKDSKIKSLRTEPSFEKPPNHSL